MFASFAGGSADIRVMSTGCLQRFSSAGQCLYSENWKQLLSARIGSGNFLSEKMVFAVRRVAVLTRLGHVDGKGLVLTKGRAACEIDAADELLTTELMFNGVFSKLDKHQIVALASCLIPLGEKSSVSLSYKLVKHNLPSQGVWLFISSAN